MTTLPGTADVVLPGASRPTTDPNEPGYHLETTKLGMWVFLSMEVLFFGALFFLYGSERFFYPAAFSLGSEHLEMGLATLNTGLLLTSSLMMVLAVDALNEKRNARLARTYLIFTSALGLCFLVSKAYEYKLDFDHGLVPVLKYAPDFAHPPQLELFMGLYFVATAIHALHVIIGLGWIGTLAKRLTPSRPQTTASQIESLGLYWHFVDVVWIFLFPLFYLIGVSS